MKNFIYILITISMLTACGDKKKKSSTPGGGQAVAVTPLNGNHHQVCNDLLPASIARTEYNLGNQRVYIDRFYDSAGNSYKHRSANQGYYSNVQQSNEFINNYTQETFVCNRLYAIDDFIEYQYGSSRFCADYRFDNYSRSYVNKYDQNIIVNYNHQLGGFFMPDNSRLNCHLQHDNYYYALFYSYRINTGTGIYGSYQYNVNSGGNIKDFLKGAALIGIGAAIINYINK